MFLKIALLIQIIPFDLLDQVILFLSIDTERPRFFSES